MNLFKKIIISVSAAAIALVAVPAVSASAAIALPDNEAIAYVDNLGAIWNLGNAFDAKDCDGWITNELDYESGWCGAKTTEKLIEELKNVGFDTIRIPVSWHNHVDGNFNISQPWMDRVQEVVDWCLAEDLNVILNVHHDVEQGYYFPTAAHHETSKKYMKAVWSQIADEFKDYDNRLIFETINEPRVVGTDYEWWFWLDAPRAEVAESIECINELNQIALDEIRASGNKNADRYVLIPGYDTSTDGITVKTFKLPKDTVKNRLIVDFHLYTLDKSIYTSIIDRVYNKYVANGIPAVLSEYNQDADKTNLYDGNSITYLSEWVTYARERGISCAIWDNNSDEYKLINRADSVWVHKDIAEAVCKAGEPRIKIAPEADPVPQNLKAVPGDGVITLSWDAVSGAERYRIQHYASGKWNSVSYPTANKCTLKGLTNGGKYVYRVLAYVNGKWGTPSEKILSVPNGSNTPKNLTALAGNGQITLKWTAVNGAVKYRVQHYGSNGWTTVAYPKTDTHTVTGLKNGGKYVYRVLAYVNGKWSSASAKVLAIPTANSTVPSNLKASAANGYATISWSGVNNAIKYRVQMNDGSGWATVAYTKETTVVTTYTLSNKEYSFRVLAYVNGAWNDPSAVVTVTPVN